MKIILPRLTLLLAAFAAMPAMAQLPRIASIERAEPWPSSNSAQAEPLSPGDQLLRQVAAQLEHRESIAARMRYQVSVEGRQLAGAGSYWQDGSGNALRIRLELRIAGETNLLQVSNGRFLWTDASLPTGRNVTRLDLRQLRSDAMRDEPELDGLGAGQATWSPIRPEIAPHAGGLPALVTSLEEHFTFSPPQAMRWTPSPPLSGVGESLPVYAVVGRWKRDRLVALLPHLENPSKKKSAAPPARVPQEVLLLVGQTDLFPYRVEYRRLNDPAVATSSPDDRTPYQLSADPIVLLEYYDVVFNTPIAAGQFDYSPGEVKWDDRTAEHLEQLRQQRQQLATRSRSAESR
jgi:hypothetical protein